MVKKENNRQVETDKVMKNYYYCESCEKYIGKNWWKRHLENSAHLFNLINDIQSIINEQLMMEFDNDYDSSVGTIREKETWEPYQQLRNAGYFDNMRTLEDFDLMDYNDRVDEILRKNRE